MPANHDTPPKNPNENMRKAPVPRQSGTAGRRIPASALFGPEREVIIELEGVDYRLRITSNGKLVLNK